MSARSPAAGAGAPRGLLALDAIARPEVAQHLVGTGDDLVARLELGLREDRDVRLRRDAGAHLAELGLLAGQDEDAGDLALLALERVDLLVLGRGGRRGRPTLLRRPRGRLALLLAPLLELLGLADDDRLDGHGQRLVGPL